MNNNAKENVPNRILETFIGNLKKETGFEEIAERLREALFKEKINESSIRNALFDDEEKE